MIEYKSHCGMNYIELAGLNRFPGLKTIMSVRNDLALRELKAKASEALGGVSGTIVTVKQVHGDEAVVVDKEYIGRYYGGKEEPPSADAIMTGLKGVKLAIYTADCLPIILFAAEKRALALVHAGKAGTAKGVTALSAEKMIKLFGSVPGSVTAAIGPSIGPCCYEIDLWAENERQLKSAGIRHIINPRVCTACNVDRFFSYRREKGTTGRMITAATLI